MAFKPSVIPLGPATLVPGTTDKWFVRYEVVTSTGVHRVYERTYTLADAGVGVMINQLWGLARAEANALEALLVTAIPAPPKAINLPTGRYDATNATATLLTAPETPPDAP